MYRIVGIGEVLWDMFPNGPQFGGAPANFACSSAALAQESAHVSMISAVGDDELGQRALAKLGDFGVDTSAIQVKSDPTGQVNVRLDGDGVASFVFQEDSAWDQLSWNITLGKIAMECDAVCFGSLGQRGQCSRETIRRFVSTTPEAALRVLDVNLRTPFWSSNLIRESLALANVLKLNDDELQAIAALSGARGSEVEMLRQIANEYQLRVVALTRGSHGAVICAGNEVSDRPGETVNVVDTVGAGDVFTGALTLGLLNGHTVDTINEHAIASASYCCSRPGATMKMPDRLLRYPSK